eukprot:6142664-Amphidinium_carterae.1
MPSRYEPCGIPQMVALAYGTLPIVHATGGLKDSVRDVRSSDVAERCAQTQFPNRATEYRQSLTLTYIDNLLH